MCIRDRTCWHLAFIRPRPGQRTQIRAQDARASSIHQMAMPPSAYRRMPKKFLRAQLYKSSNRGRPKIKWLDNILEDLRGMDVSGYADMAMSRRLWKRLMLKD